MERKICNPFKKFIRNIVVGLCLILSVFSIGAIVAGKNATEVEAATSDCRIYIYYYKNDSGTVVNTTFTKNLTHKYTRTYTSYDKIWDFWPVKYHYGYQTHTDTITDTYSCWAYHDGFLEMGYDLYYLGTNTTTKDWSTGVYSDQARTLTKGSRYYLYNVESGNHCVGFFGNSNLTSNNMIASGSSFIYNGEKNIYILISNDDYGFQIDFTDNYLRVGSKIWMSNYATSAKSSSISGKNGDSKTISMDSVSGFTLYLYSKDAFDQDIMIPQGTYTIFYYNNALQLWGAQGKYSLSGTNVISCRTVYEPKSQTANDKIYYSGGKVIFNIFNNEDLTKFATEVNNTYMNSVLANNYKAVLKNNLGNITIPCIGASDSPFKGEFDGNGYSITNLYLIPTNDCKADYNVRLSGGVMSTTSGSAVDCASTVGMFGEVLNGCIKNLKVSGSIGVSNSYTKKRYTFGGVAHSYTETGKSDTNNYIYLGRTSSGSYAYVGAVCGNMVGGEIKNVQIGKVGFAIKFVLDNANCNMGSLVGKSEGVEITDCKIGTSTIMVSRGSEAEGSSSGSSYNIGGLVGSANTTYVSNATINNYRFDNTNDSWPDIGWMSGDRFCAGGLTGYLNKSTLTKCFVNDGSQDYSGIYLREYVCIGGIAGSSISSPIRECYSANPIIVNFLSDPGTWIHTSDDCLCVGGIVGKCSGGSISNSSYDVTKDEFKVISGVYDGKHIFTPSNPYKVMVGGIAGLTENTVYIVNVSVSIGDVSVDQVDEGYFGIYVGKNNGYLDLANSYACMKSFTKGAYRTSFSIGDYNGGALRANGINYIFYGASALNGEINGSEIDLSNNNSTLIENVLEGKVYGYNESIQSNIIENGTSAPFLLSHAKSYTNVVISCWDSSKNKPLTNLDKVQWGTETNNGYLVKQSGSENYVKYIYGTAITGMFYNETQQTYKLPANLYYDGNTQVTYYSKDINGTTKDALPGDIIDGNGKITRNGVLLGEGVGTGTVTLYPIFQPGITVYSPCELKTMSGVTVEENNISYVYKVTQLSYKSDGYYKYSYFIQNTNNKNITSISEDALTNYLVKPKNENDKVNVKINSTSLMLDKDTSTGIYTATYKEAQELYSADYYTENKGSITIHTSAYVHVYKTATVNYLDSSKVYEVKSESDSLKYENSADMVIPYGTTINFNGVDNLAGYGDIYTKFASQTDDQKALKYVSSGTVFVNNYSNPSGTELTKGTASKEIKYTNDSFSNWNIFLSYSEPCLKIYYYDINGNPSSPTTILYNADGTIDSQKVKNAIVGYNDVFSSKNYAFTGWTYTSSNNTYFITKNSLQNILVNKFNENEIHLYPTFVKYNDKDIQIGSVKEIYSDISSVDDFIVMNYMVNWGEGASYNYKLTTNLDFTGYTNLTPIGINDGCAFSGSFDGKGNTIKNLEINVPYFTLTGINLTNQDKISYSFNDKAYIGLFGYVASYNSNSITNINLINCKYTCRNLLKVNAGGIAGYSYAPISNCLVEGELFNNETLTYKTSSYIGGIVGVACGNISECVAKIDSINAAGSIAGAATSGKIVNCFDVKRNSANINAIVKTKSSSVQIQNTYSVFSGSSSGTVYYGATLNNISSWYNDASIDKTIWAQNSKVNNGMPYLKNTGITNVNFVINADTTNNGYLLTDNDITRFGSLYDSSEKMVKISKQFFMLDKYTYDNNLKELYIDDTTQFNILEGYTFEGYGLTYKDKTIYSNESAERNNIFSNNNKTYYLKFTPKIVNIKYITTAINGTNYTLSVKQVAFGTKYYIESMDSVLLTAVNGYEVVNYTIDDETYNANAEITVAKTDIIITVNCQQVNYKLTFCDGDGKQLYKNSSPVYIAGNYNKNIQDEFNSITYSQTGNICTGWGYYNNSTLVKFTSTIMPELRKNPYNVYKNRDGVYELFLYPILQPIEYRITYNNGSKQVTQKGITYNSNVTLYTDETNISLYNTGYKLVGFEDANNLAANNNLINNINKALKNKETFVYTAEDDISLNCIYERLDYTIEVVANSEDLAVYYNETDYETKKTTKDNIASFNSDRYIITTKYCNSITLHFVLKSGARINAVSASGNSSYTFNLNNIQSVSDYSEELIKLREQTISKLSTKTVYNIQTSRLNNNSNVEQEAITQHGLDYTQYNIKTADDLFTVICKGYTTNARSILNLKNNIDITGYNILISNLSATIEGNGYSINGFTSYQYNYDDNLVYSFIKTNYGNINNLVFNNIIVDIENLSTVLEEKYFGLIEQNEGNISSVYVKTGSIKIASNLQNYNIGGLVGNNKGEIILSKVCDLIIKDKSTNSVIGILVGCNQGNICYCEADATIQGNGAYYGAVVGNYLVGEIANLLLGENISSNILRVVGKSNFDKYFENIISYSSVNGTTQLKGKSFSQLQEIDIPGFALAYEYGKLNYSPKIIIPSLDKQVFDVNVNFVNTNSENIGVKINSSSITDYDDLVVYTKLNNELGFMQTTVATYSPKFVLALTKNSVDVTNKFNIENSIDNNGEIVSSIIVTNLSKENSVIDYYVSAKQEAVVYKLYVKESDKFKEADIKKLTNSIKICKEEDGVYNNVEFTASCKDSSGDTIYEIIGEEVYIIYELKLNNNLCFNDNVKLDIKLPSFAIFSEEYGIQKQISGSGFQILKNTCGNTTFTETYNVNNGTNYNIYIDRSVIFMVLDLNKDDLYEDEQNNIKFSQTFITNNSNAELQEDGTLTIEIEPLNGSAAYGYSSPVLNGVLDYIYNGTHYKFKGFKNVETNELYYNENFEYCYSEGLTEEISLYATWEAVEYTIVIDNLENESSYSKVFFTSKNGYTDCSSGVKKTFKFAESVSLPSVQKMQYNNCYEFVGFELGEETISDKYALFNTYKILNNNYTNTANNKEITIKPIFEEIEYTLNFYSRINNDEYRTVLLYNSKEEDEVTLKLTLSDVLNNNYTLPTASREHHEFIGFSKQNSSDYISYNGGSFVYNKDILLADGNFYAQYKVNKVSVTITYQDVNNNEMLDYTIQGLNSLTNVEYKEENKQITFEVDYKTTSFVLPTVKVLNEGYKFENYSVNGTIYNSSYSFVQNTEIKVICSYKVDFYTKNGTINNYNVVILQSSSYGYNFYSTAQTITLPTPEQVTKEGFVLTGYICEGEPISELVLTKPTSVEFIYEGETYKLTLTTTHAVLPATLPLGEYSKYIESYTKINDTKVEVKVAYNTSIQNIKNALPTPVCEDGYGFVEFEFSQSGDKITENGSVLAKVLQNEYNIYVYKNDEEVYRIENKHYNDVIVNSFEPEEIAGQTYVGLSLNKSFYVQFNIPDSMTQLEKLYTQTTRSYNVYSLTVYAYYISEINVTIKANQNCMLENTTSIASFEGGGAFNKSVSFKITAENIQNKNLVLPTPTVQNELLYAIFKGYSYNNGEQNILVVDGNGIILDTFVYATNIELDYVFEYSNYNFDILANYNTIIDTNGFKTNANGFTKSIQFNAEIGNLPVISLNNYIFKGYYISNSADDLLDANFDIQISDANGILLDDYKYLTGIYFDNQILKSIVAKYEYDYAYITITSENEDLGVILETKYLDDSICEYENIDGGYKVKVIKGSDIQIAVNTFADVATFNNFAVNKVCNILDIYSENTLIYKVTEDLEIVANFNYKTFTITYIIDDEEVNLTPNEFNVDTEITEEDFALIKIEKFGYQFNGWFTEKLFVNQVKSITKGQFKNNLVLYGKYTAKEINVSIYTSNVDDYANHTVIKVTFGSKMSNLPTLKLNGHNFVGLFTEQQCGGILVNSDSKCIFNEDIDLYAYFIKEDDSTLKGYGTETSPYLISSFEDFEMFANLINFASNYNTSKKYYKLTANINLENNIYIGKFNANFNGDGYVIYSNNKILGYNKLDGDGIVTKNLGLFAQNNGVIKNIVLVNNVSNLSNSENVDVLNLGNVCGINNGEINNVVVYYSINIVGLFDTMNIGEIAGNNDGVTGCSSYNSKIIIQGSEQTYSNILDKHLHSKNTTIPQIKDNKYQITSSEEFAYLLTLNSIDKEVELTCDIDMKGKLFEDINYNLVINGNGYVIKNLISLNGSNTFSGLKLNKVGLESIVVINLFNNETNIIGNANGITLSYIIIDISNINNIIYNNNEEITNSYFVGQEETLIYNNTNVITNSYVYNMGLMATNNATNNNFVVLTDETSVENFMDVVNNDIWFKDVNSFMNKVILPCLISVGNYVVNFVYDENIIEVTETKSLSSLRVITKESEDFVVIVDLINIQYNIVDILINDVSCIENYANGILTIYKSNIKIKNVEFILELKDYTVVYSVEDSLSGVIKIEDEEETSITKSVKAGSAITAEVITNEDYYFIGWSDGNTETIRTDTIYSNVTFTAKINKKFTYNLILENLTNIIVSDLNAKFVQDGDNYIIKLKQEEDINDYLPTIIKTDYKFVQYLIEKVDDFTYDIIPVFLEDYVVVNLIYNNQNGACGLISADEYSQGDTNLLVIKESNNNYYTVLRNHTLTLKVNPMYCYLTKIIINGEELDIDYSVYENNEMETFIDILITDETEIEVQMQEIMITTIFDVDVEQASINLINETFENVGVVISSKGKALLFAVTTIESVVISSFELNGEIIELSQNSNNEYVYIPKQDATLKVNLKTREINISVNYNYGGEVVTDAENKTEMESELYEESYTFSIGYKQSCELFVVNYDNYIIKSISMVGKETTLLTGKVIKITDAVEDLTLNVIFERVNTWLDLNEEGEPMRFMLQNFVGIGTRTSPYIISSINDILSIAYNVNVKGNNYSNKYFKAKSQDLVLDFSKYYFQSIGTDDCSFDGIILGNNITLKCINIIGNKNVGLFKVLGQNAIIKSINLEGEIDGNFKVGSICGTNNGTILGCSNNSTILNTNYIDNDENVTGGICAINNGTISRTFNEGKVQSTSKLVGGICAINNQKVENIYNTGYIYNDNSVNESIVLAGLVAQNAGTVKFGYNDSRVVANNASATISGTTVDNNGTTESIYYNSNKLTTTLGTAQTYEELTTKTNPIYKEFDFVKIWSFNSYVVAPPKLNVIYEYSGSITFVVTFSDEIKDNEKLLLLELTNKTDLSYCLIANKEQNIVSLYNLLDGEYYLTLTSLLGNTISTEQDLKITLDETVGTEIIVNISISKKGTKGYYSNVII